VLFRSRKREIERFDKNNYKLLICIVFASMIYLTQTFESRTFVCYY